MSTVHREQEHQRSTIAPQVLTLLTQTQNPWMIAFLVRTVSIVSQVRTQQIALRVTTVQRALDLRLSSLVPQVST
jgi:hypothetical protein